jgi:hypothetical protein
MWLASAFSCSTVAEAVMLTDTVPRSTSSSVAAFGSSGELRVKALS